MDEFLLRALAAGAGLALVAGPLGCFVVWRRMAYFGDTLAHCALLGVVAGMMLGVDLLLGVAAVCVAVALALAGIERQRRLSSDTALGILSHGALALGLVLLSRLDQVRMDLMGWLFGDVLSVTAADLTLLWGGAALILLALWRLWPTLVAMAVDEDLARAEGHAVERARLALVVLVALLVAVSMKLVGLLLVTSLLVIPAAAARRWSRTPETMAATAALLGVLAVGSGLWGSWQWDTPSGPSIVVAAAALFLLGQFLPRRD